MVARVSARSLRATYALSYASKKGCEGCSLALVYRVTQSLAELGKPHTAPPQNLQTTIMRSVGGLTTKTSTRTPRARAGSAPPNSKGSVVPYKPLFSDPRARLWPLGRVRGREVSSVESPSSQLQETTPGRAATRLQGSLASSRLHRLRAAAINCSFARDVVRRDHHLPSSRMHPRLRR